MRICVYAICKNEEKNILSWVNSMKEADDIYVLDTGSSDNSYELLKSLNINVKRKIIKPWRFDDARNESLNLIDKEYDLYVCTDIDERFRPGWRDILEKNYKKEYTRIKYLYNWSFDQMGKPSTTFYLNKIHNKSYKWTHPVHEVLTPLDKENELLIEGIILDHFQSFKKSRQSYLPLLELSVKENPNDDRNMHYLGREYMYYKKYYKCIETLHKHLNLKTATWKDERSASMRYMARSYKELGFLDEAKYWYEKSINEAPYLREGYVELAILNTDLKNYEESNKLLDKAFTIKEKSKTYINEYFAWNYQIYYLYAINAYYLNKKDIANKYYNIAISIEPNNEILLNNKSFFN